MKKYNYMIVFTFTRNKDTHYIELYRTLDSGITCETLNDLRKEVATQVDPDGDVAILNVTRFDEIDHW